MLSAYEFRLPIIPSQPLKDYLLNYVYHIWVWYLLIPNDNEWYAYQNEAAAVDLETRGQTNDNRDRLFKMVFDTEAVRFIVDDRPESQTYRMALDLQKKLLGRFRPSF